MSKSPRRRPGAFVLRHLPVPQTLNLPQPPVEPVPTRENAARRVDVGASFTSRTNRPELKASCAQRRDQPVGGLHCILTVGSWILVMPVVNDDDVTR